ncbi:MULTISPECIES: hypothetical protein [unclassified Streptomyces]|uniref:Uncharacterized protein n=1 Tax=Streptomyces flavovirens TaxID=52258 RepID=A0ABV8N3M3_9ACTN|nr:MULTISPECIES: hypothetical protein [unclassified Streptomyces]AEN13992.1 conserved hypothetical protein [Streptomyces sp. SirexAA-E]MBK3594726.1 hypothetical protein [Streptomyces sp. MBT51]MYR67777.1 hypothetical protein [Streptomyces sp. SID4939]MYR99383.1 hypothetical protein [Streptomyces sp. SID4940]MYT67881.1 hypothetical protein [Streptomyces sp. SID8357]
MTDRRSGRSAAAGTYGVGAPLPRDMPDQQVQRGEDPLDVLPPPEDGAWNSGSSGSADPTEGLPSLDESGAGRGEARQAGAHPEHPVPDEQSG